MSPKLKAESIVNKFKDHVNPYIGSGMLSNIIDDEAILYQSKKCGLIEVDEILNVLNSPPIKNESRLWKSQYNYFEQVREEIINLTNP